jgi:CubicO group peptidase (beta-lactamase class C family)
MRARGRVAPGFEPVRDAFEQLLGGDGELGASLAVQVEGYLVVDLWGGFTDRWRRRRWRRRDLCNVTSCSKGVTAALLLRLVQQGVLALDAPVARYWEGFAQAGKEAISVRDLLNHRAGLAAVDAPVHTRDFETPARLAPKLARQAPLWEPGTAQGYGATSWGMYAGELVRRITGQHVGTALRRELTEPLGLDLFLGLPVSEHPRTVPIRMPRIRQSLRGLLPAAVQGRAGEGQQARRVLFRGSIAARAVANPQDLAGAGLRRLASPEIWQRELPWVGVMSTARALARLYGGLAGGEVDGRQVWDAGLLRGLHPRQSWSEDDLVYGKPLGFSQGFMKEETHLFSPHPETFGHTGISGALSFADPVVGMGFGFVPNQMQWQTSSPERRALVRAIYGCVGVTRWPSA